MDARSFSVEDVGQALDEAGRFIQAEARILRNRTSLSLIANERQYALSSTVYEPGEVEFYDGNTGTPVVGLGHDHFREHARVIRRAARPLLYHYLETERVLLFDPIPDTAAGTTAINDAAGITATATSVTVDSTAGFPSAGRLIIGSEVMGYENTTSTTFARLRRGLEGTTAATHADDATVTERDILIHGYRMYRDFEMWTYYSTGTATATNGSASVTGTTTVWSTNVAAGDFFGTTSDSTAVAPTRWYEISSVGTDTALTLTSNYTQPTATGSSYIICSPNPFPNYADGALIAFAISRLLMKVGREADSRAQWAIVERFLKQTMRGQIKSDAVRVPRPLSVSRAGTRMPLWIGDTRIT